MIVKERYKTLDFDIVNWCVKPGAIPKYQYYYVIGIPSNNGSILVKDSRGRTCKKHLLSVDVVKE